MEKTIAAEYGKLEKPELDNLGSEPDDDEAERSSPKEPHIPEAQGNQVLIECPATNSKIYLSSTTEPMKNLLEYSFWIKLNFFSDNKKENPLVK